MWEMAEEKEMKINETDFLKTHKDYWKVLSVISKAPCVFS